MRISTLRHPEYQDDSYDYFKWRLAYKGGRRFIDHFLQKFSKREDKAGFEERRKISYSPSFAKAAIDKLKNTFFSRMSEIKRIGGSTSYREAVEGIKGGVDLKGCSMNSFIGQDVIEELMTMRKVGIFVDKPQLDGNLLSNNKDKRPYLYYYRTEDILTWDWSCIDGEYVYTNVLLRDTNYDYDKTTGLVLGVKEKFRHMWLGADDQVHIQFWLANEDEDAESDVKLGEEIILPMNRLPFTIAGLRESLMTDVADYQISLMNIASADINYVYKANFPFYTEQFDPAMESLYSRRPPPPRSITKPATNDPTDGSSDAGQLASDAGQELRGALEGRKYPKGMDRPDFIAPPSEPLMASMAKQDQMKREIFELIDIAASQAQPQHASADSKQMDDRGLESGLSYIGLELEYIERQVAQIWAIYEGGEPATVNYPEKYTLKSDADRLMEAEALGKVKMSVPSRAFTKEVDKQIAYVMLEGKVDMETMDKIRSQIDAAEFASSDPDLIKTAAELGMVDAVTGSNALGFNGEKVVPVAKKEHTEKLAEIAKSQSQANPAARGTPSPVAGRKEAAKKEKADPAGGKKKQRGEGK